LFCQNGSIPRWGRGKMLFLKDQEAEAEEGEEAMERLIDGSRRRRNGFEGNVVWLEAILKIVPPPLGGFRMPSDQASFPSN